MQDGPQLKINAQNLKAMDIINFDKIPTNNGPQQYYLVFSKTQ